MDPKLLSVFNKELSYLREQSKDFAKLYPKAAANLGITENSIHDPFVERLLEGFAFVAARIHLKIDAEFPKFSARLLDTIYPAFLAPTPSFCIVQMDSEHYVNQGEGSYTIPRGTRLKVQVESNKKTTCEYKTTQDIMLFPLKIEKVVVDIAQNLPNGSTGKVSSYDKKAILEFKFSLLESDKQSKKIPDKIDIYIDGSAMVTGLIYELLSDKVLALQMCTSIVGDWISLPVEYLSFDGFSDDHAALPEVKSVFSGYRILREYFSFPQKFNFFSISGLRDFLINSDSVFYLRVVLDCEFNSNVAGINEENFKLFCSPAINIIDRKSVRLPLENNNFEYHAISDVVRPLDYEVFSINKIEGYSKDNTIDTIFLPLHSSRTTYGSSAYFSVRREERLVSESMLKHGHRTAYVGSEVFFSLVDKNDLPVSVDIKQVAIEMTVTNRDLPILIQGQTQKNIVPVGSLPISNIRMIDGPSTPRALPQSGSLVWMLIKHLGLNYNDLIRGDDPTNLEAVKEILSLYSILGDPSVALNIESIIRFSTKFKNMRIPGAGPMVFGRGIEIVLTIDESRLHYHGTYLFASVLRNYLLRHVSINSFILMHVFSVQRGKIATFSPVLGLRPGL